MGKACKVDQRCNKGASPNGPIGNVNKGLCCDKETRKIKKGPEHMSNRWCSTRASDGATRALLSEDQEEDAPKPRGTGELPGTNGRNGRRLLTVDAKSPPSTAADASADTEEDAGTNTVYEFEFEVSGEITVGEFEVTFFAAYADGEFEAGPYTSPLS